LNCEKPSSQAALVSVHQPAIRTADGTRMHHNSDPDRLANSFHSNSLAAVVTFTGRAFVPAGGSYALEHEMNFRSTKEFAVPA
jgi:hypothetical protein